MRRAAAFLLTFLCVPAGMLYAGYPWLALALGLWLPFELPTVLVGYALGAVSAKTVVTAAIVYAALAWGSPLLAALLPPREGQPGQRPGVYLLVIPAYYLLVVGLMLLTRAFVVEPYAVPAASMAPALVPGDQILVRKLGADVVPGAIVVFRHPTLDPPTDFVKRVVATGGQTVEVRGGVVLVDGVALPRVDRGAVSDLQDSLCQPIGERRVYEETLGGRTYRTYSNPEIGRAMADFGPKTVPEGELFVLGDNRDDSADSRLWGFVPAESVEGVVGDVWLAVDPCDGRMRGDRKGPVR